jgi:transcriptional regulator with XRE-family HTH domain
MSQSALGKTLELSFQQMQKYERGMSSIGAGQLCEIAKALDVPVSFFYDGLSGVSLSPNPDAQGQDDRFTRDELEMLSHYRAVPDHIRDDVRSLLGYLSKQDLRHVRVSAEGAAAKQESIAAVPPSEDGAGAMPTSDGTGPDSVKDEFTGLGADVERKHEAAGEIPGSVPPEMDEARSAVLEVPEQHVPVARRRGRPRKSAGQPPAEFDMTKPDSGGTKAADRPERTSAKGRKPADKSAAATRGNLRGVGRPAAPPAPGKAGQDKKAPRRTRGAIWTPADIGK